MNCWFCHNPIANPDSKLQNIYCSNFKCSLYNVNYKFTCDYRFNNEHYLVCAQLQTTLPNYRYIINYWVKEGKMNILYQLKEDGAFEYAIRTNYYSIVLTPDNVNNKLPILLLLS